MDGKFFAARLRSSFAYVQRRPLKTYEDIGAVDVRIYGHSLLILLEQAVFCFNFNKAFCIITYTGTGYMNKILRGC